MHQRDFEPRTLQLRHEARNTPRPALWPPKHKPGEWFLKGPIPLSWLSLAAALPGKALVVALELWLWAGIKNRRAVSISLSNLRVSPDTSRSGASRGLAALQNAGLVSVQRRPGRRPDVTLVEVPPPTCTPSETPGR